MVGCTLVPNEMKIVGCIMEAHPNSALYILRHLNPAIYKSGSDRALYGLLLFQALDKRDKPLQPDSLIDYSISYFLSENDDAHLAAFYFYKGNKCKRAQHFDETASFYLKALDCLQNKNDNYLLGRIYSDMGGMCAIQRDYKESLKKYRYSLEF
jgi:tetratricopeptide (TPR) repeat protein